MFEDEFKQIFRTETLIKKCYWIEPAWKSIISNKMFCVLYDLFKIRIYTSCFLRKPITENYEPKSQYLVERVPMLKYL